MELKEQKAINTIINYAALRKIKVFLDVDVQENPKNGNYYPQIQIDYKHSKLNDLAFFFGASNNELINLSAIFFVDEDHLSEMYNMKQEFKHWNQKAFQYFIVADDNEFHLYSELKPEEITKEYLDEVISFFNSDYIKRIREIEELD